MANDAPCIEVPPSGRDFMARGSRNDRAARLACSLQIDEGAEVFDATLGDLLALFAKAP